MAQYQIILTEEARRLALDSIAIYVKVLEPASESSSPLPQVLIENTKGKRFVVVVTAGDGEKSATMKEHVSEGRKLLRNLADNPDVVRYAALAYDATMTVDGKRMSAIVVEILYRDATQVFAQSYSREGYGKIQLINKPKYLVNAEFKPQVSTD